MIALLQRLQIIKLLKE